MTNLKKHIVYTFLAIFILTAATGLSGLIGVVGIKTESVGWLFSFLIVQCVTVIVAIIKAPEYFTEPEAITELTEKHQKEISELHAQLAKSNQDHQNLLMFYSMSDAERKQFIEHCKPSSN